ncbi:MAG: 50S ribosomal protein L16 [Planctomycetota bacterium]|nr:50S ribosomal protein L16 [Planctomycetota bacterium]
MPKRTKYRKVHRGKVKGTYKCHKPDGKGVAGRNMHRRGIVTPKKRVATAKATRGNRVAFGDYGLQALEWCWLSARVIEASRIAANRHIGGGRLYIRVFPHKPVTAKPLEVRMGSGKGDVDRWVATVLPGTILFEIGGVPEEVARKAFNRVSHKLPVRVRMVDKKTI